MEKSFKFFLIVTLLLGLITILPAPTFFFVALATAFLYAGYSESWNIVGGYAGYTSLGHGALFGLSAYFVALLLQHFGTSPLLTIPLGGLLCIIIAIIIGYPTMRLRGYYFALATLSLPIIFGAVVVSFPDITLGGRGVSNIYITEIPFELRPQIYYMIFLLYMAVCATVAYMVERSKFGMGLVAIRDDEVAAEACGINTTKLKVEAFIISGFLTGIAGGFYGTYLTYISPSTAFGILPSIIPVLMAILGGRNTWLGPIIGGIVLDLLRQYISYTFPGVLNTLIFGGILIIFTILFPEGVVGMIKKGNLVDVLNKYKYRRIGHTQSR